MFTQEEITQITTSVCNTNKFVNQIFDHLPDEFVININFQPVIKVTNGEFENKSSLVIVFSNSTTVDFNYMEVTPELTPNEVADKILTKHYTYLMDNKL